MGFLDSLATGYQRGQAQYAANQRARADAAEKAAKAAQDAAEFRLKLEQHSQTLMNSAEAEYTKIMGQITNENWDPAQLGTLLPQIANFDKTYGRIWKGGRLSEQIPKMLHLDPAVGAVPEGQQGPQPEDGATSPLYGYVSDAQREAAAERGRAANIAKFAPDLIAGASKAIRGSNGTFMEPSLAYTRLYDWYDTVVKSGQFNALDVDKILDTVREQMADVYKSMADAEGNGEQLQTRKDAIGKESSAWITSVLQMDQSDGSMDFQNMFATRTPLRMEMEKFAQGLAQRGESLGSIKAQTIYRFRNEVGGLNLDIKASPYAGSLKLAGVPKEAIDRVTRFYDMNVSPDEDYIEPMSDGGEVWMVNRVNPANSMRVWPDYGSPLTPDSVIAAVPGQKPPAEKASEPAPSTTVKPPNPPKAPKPEKPKEPEVSVEELMKRNPSSLNGVEMARVTKSMTGPDFIRWLSGKGRSK